MEPECQLLMIIVGSFPSSLPGWPRTSRASRTPRPSWSKRPTWGHRKGWPPRDARSTREFLPGLLCSNILFHVKGLKGEGDRWQGTVGPRVLVSREGWGGGMRGKGPSAMFHFISGPKKSQRPEDSTWMDLRWALGHSQWETPRLACILPAVEYATAFLCKVGY